MSEIAIPDSYTEPTVDGILVKNIIHFSTALRRAGLPVGPSQVSDAVHAIAVSGFSNREDFFGFCGPALLAETSTAKSLPKFLDSIGVIQDFLRE